MTLRHLARRGAIAAASLLTLAAVAGAQSPVAARADTAPPPIAREFRGVWIATVNNIDWPSRIGLSPFEQQAEMIALLNRAVAMHLNAIIFQVRPQADALYDSELEPWSPYLSGTMGRPPEPFYDPLAFVVREAHARGLEVHAWFNPYRALQPGSPGSLAPSHVSRAEPGIVRQYASSMWMDPGDSATVARTERAILDVVRRYDIDAVHLDDYFYPYRETDASGRNIDFPDAATYDRYRRAGGTLGVGDWRRDNVNRFVEDIGRLVHAAKPWVRFGISPFGIWRPGSPASVRGLDSYAEIFADSRKWLTAGWVDYMLPQLYWPVARPQQSFTELLGWWVSQNTHGRNIWAGLNTSLARDVSRGRGAGEIIDQVRLTRAQPGASGDAYFSMRTLVEDPDSVVEKLARDAYAAPALVPASPWLDSRQPPVPDADVRVDAASGELVVLIDPPQNADVPWQWVIQTRGPLGWTTTILPGVESEHLLAPRGAPPPFDVRVYAVSRTGVLSAAARPSISQ